jgi:hypothetical protein
MFRLTAVIAATLLLSAAAFAGTDVPVAHFSDLNANSGANVKLVYGSTQRVTVIKGDLKKGSIEVKDGRTLVVSGCKGFFCMGNHQLDVEVVTPRIDSVDASSGADVHASGNFPKQPHLRVQASSGGDADVRAIPAESVDANASSGGDAHVNVLSTLNANASSGGDVRYTGHPAHINSQSSSGGDVKAE